ncbi:Gti1/Pac2 family-domain-containing protein [Choanephora cucurbitarum]|nr:Gti1/Pac2 family-domain-containing protein [Choanephora cucurbitarum]
MMTIKVTFEGYIETTKDALLIFEACKRGVLPRVTRRLKDNERHLIQSGAIFCFDEQESRIKRWTDGLVWSPSRILGHFLIYRELQNKTEWVSSSLERRQNRHKYIIAPELLKQQQEKAMLGSLAKTQTRFKQHGLIKKSISLMVDGVQQHLICYYTKEDVLCKRLKTPSSQMDLASLELSSGLHLRQNFRASKTDKLKSSISSNSSNSNQILQPVSQNQTVPEYNVMPSSMSYYPLMQVDDYQHSQNPHQHLFSSHSFHAINHASIIPQRSTDLVAANAFMVDPLLGWNEFEWQM